jgi:hypothetical protein
MVGVRDNLAGGPTAVITEPSRWRRMTLSPWATARGSCMIGVTRPKGIGSKIFLRYNFIASRPTRARSSSRWPLG